MRTRRTFYPEKVTVHRCELEECPSCHGQLRVAYNSGQKTVQTMNEVMAMSQQTKRCVDEECPTASVVYGSVKWQQIAPIGCTYGYDVIAQIGWTRQMMQQTFAAIHTSLKEKLQISETEVRALVIVQGV
jgi:hypothetical protein